MDIKNIKSEFPIFKQKINGNFLKKHIVESVLAHSCCRSAPALLLLLGFTMLPAPFVSFLVFATDDR